MNSVTLRTGHRRLAVALALVGVTMLVFASVAGAQSSPSEYPPPPPSPLAPPDWEGDLTPMIGDVTLDGSVDGIDALAIMQHVVRIITLSESQLAVGDTTNDGGVNGIDALHIMQFVVDRNQTQGILQIPLWEWPADAAFLDPKGSNAG